MGAFGLFLVGCEKRPEGAQEVPAVQPRHEDAAYQKALSADRVRYAELVRERNAIAEKMKALVEAKKAELKTDDLEKVKAALEVDPTWRALTAACSNAQAYVERQRQVALGDVRARMLREQAERQAAEKQRQVAAKQSADKGKAPVRVLPEKSISK